MGIGGNTHQEGLGPAFHWKGKRAYKTPLGIEEDSASQCSIGPGALTGKDLPMPGNSDEQGKS